MNDDSDSEDECSEDDEDKMEEECPVLEKIETEEEKQKREELEADGFTIVTSKNKKWFIYI